MLAAAPSGDGRDAREGLGDTLRRGLGVRAAGERVVAWHVSPVVDVLAYHFSWLLILVPLLASGPRFPIDYAPWFMVVLTVSFVHRHATLGVAYLDRGTYTRHRRALLWAPVVAGLGLAASPWLAHTVVSAGRLAIGSFRWPAVDTRIVFVFTGIVVVAGVWNVWHTLSQKYGILRIYDAKARAEGLAGVPAWVDRWFAYGWVPLVVLHVATHLGDFVSTEYAIARPVVDPALAALRAVGPIGLPLAGVLAVAGVVVFARFEWRARGLGCRPRWSMAVGLSALWACLFVFDPIKVYIAFGFSHAVEYLVFVWAFQRRRRAVATSTGHASELARSAARVPLALGVLAIAYVLLNDWRELAFWSLPDVRVASLTVGEWVFCWGVWESFVHFYLDGRLWKTRSAPVREAL